MKLLLLLFAFILYQEIAAQEIIPKGNKYQLGDQIYSEYDLVKLLEQSSFESDHLNRCIKYRRESATSTALGSVGVVFGSILFALHNNNGVGARLVFGVPGAIIGLAGLGSLLHGFSVRVKANKELNKVIDLYNQNPKPINNEPNIQLGFGMISSGLGIILKF